MSQSLYQYFKKELKEAKILVRINPDSFEGLELIITNNGEVKKTKRSFDKSIYEDLDFDEFTKGNALEFNLHLQGISANK